VKQGIEVSWHSHAVIPKTVIDLFGLKPFGVPRVDSSASLAGRLDPALTRPVPPALGTTIVQPPAPSPTPPVQSPLPWGGPSAQPLPDLRANGGAKIAAPNDAVVRAKPPKLPAGL
jgi:hypothetical protein